MQLSVFIIEFICMSAGEAETSSFATKETNQTYAC